MGRLVYNEDKARFDIDDDLLRALRLAVSNKLRRRESFMLTLSMEAGAGYRSLWISPSIALTFHTYNVRAKEPDRALVEELIRGANEPDGLDLRPFARRQHDGYTEGSGPAGEAPARAATRAGSGRATR